MTARGRGRPPADLTDIDDIAVERAVHGHPVALTRADRIAAVRALTARGHARPAIAARVGATVRTVGRDLTLIRTSG